MGVASGSGCKEVYKFPHITYPYILLLYWHFFAAASLLFVQFLKYFCFFINKYIYLYSENPGHVTLAAIFVT